MQEQSHSTPTLRPLGNDGRTTNARRAFAHTGPCDQPVSRSHDEAVARALEFTCGVDQRYRRIALSRWATAYPSARGTLDEQVLTIRLRGPFGRLPFAMVAVELDGV